MSQREIIDWDVFAAAIARATTMDPQLEPISLERRLASRARIECEHCDLTAAWTDVDAGIPLCDGHAGKE